jgi:phosphoribosylanthranilate isomerase
MNLKTKVAVGGVTNLHDARYCAGMGVDWIGFPLDPALPSYLGKEAFEEIAGWITGPVLLGEVASAQGLELGQFPVDGLITNHDSVLEWAEGKLPVVWRISLDLIESPALLEAILLRYADRVEWFWVDTSEAWPEGRLAWVQALSARFPVVLGARFTPDTALEAAQSGLFGLALATGTEIRVGLNDFDALAEVLEALEA